MKNHLNGKYSLGCYSSIESSVCVCSSALVARQYIIKWLRSCMDVWMCAYFCECQIVARIHQTYPRTKCERDKSMRLTFDSWAIRRLHWLLFMKCFYFNIFLDKKNWRIVFWIRKIERWRKMWMFAIAKGCCHSFRSSTIFFEWFFYPSLH